MKVLRKTASFDNQKCDFLRWFIIPNIENRNRATFIHLKVIFITSNLSLDIQTTDSTVQSSTHLKIWGVNT